MKKKITFTSMRHRSLRFNGDTVIGGNFTTIKIITNLTRYHIIKIDTNNYFVTTIQPANINSINKIKTSFYDEKEEFQPYGMGVKGAYKVLELLFKNKIIVPISEFNSREIFNSKSNFCTGHWIQLKNSPLEKYVARELSL